MSYKVNPKILVQEDYLDGGARGGYLAYAKSLIGDDGFDGGKPVLALSTGTAIYYLNLMAALVLEGMGSGKTADVLADDLLEIFDVDKKQLVADIESCAADLAEKGILLA